MRDTPSSDWEQAERTNSTCIERCKQTASLGYFCVNVQDEGACRVKELWKASENPLSSERKQISALYHRRR